jgi:hypothetical protein
MDAYFLAISRYQFSLDHDAFVRCCHIGPMRATVFGVYLAANANNNTKWSYTSPNDDVFG